MRPGNLRSKSFRVRKFNKYVLFQVLSSTPKQSILKMNVMRERNLKLLHIGIFLKIAKVIKE